MFTWMIPFLSYRIGGWAIEDYFDEEEEEEEDDAEHE